MNDLVFLFSADADIQSAYEFCEACQAGRGEVFMRHLDAAFGQLHTFPEIAPVFHPPYRRRLIHGFPFGIFYTIEGRRIIVFGVMDLRQDPKIIRRRFISEEDWRSIQETLHLVSIPGMRDSIRKGLAEPLAKSSPKPGW